MTIGLTYTGDPSKHQHYEQWLQAGEDITIIRMQAGDQLHRVDGIVLSGGVDIHPDFYAGSATYAYAPKKGWERARDEFELSAIKYAFENDVPLLGICRGLQLINVFLDGTLIQDLGDEQFNHTHKGEPDKKHVVHVQAGTFLEKVVQNPMGEVNSAHHQAIDRLGKGLRINARSADGFVEGIEWVDSAERIFMLGVQWHPERMSNFDLHGSPFSKMIRDSFIQAAKK